MPATARRSFDPRLDGIRGLAVLLVMIHHFTVLNGDTPVSRAWSRALGFGWVGVDLFFVLSGFLITTGLRDARADARYFINFYARRTLRIVPLFYALLLVFTVIVPALNLAVTQRLPPLGPAAVWYWLFLSNFYLVAAGNWIHPALDVSWSLAIEEQFYLGWPLAVRRIRDASILKIAGVAIVAAAIVRVAHVVFGAPTIANYVLTYARMDSIAAGAALSVLLDRPDARAWLRAYAVRVWGVAAVVWFAALSAGSWDSQHPIAQIVGYGASTIAFAALLACTVTSDAGTRFDRFFRLRALRFAGTLSYGLYLLNLPVRFTLKAICPDAWFSGRGAPLGQLGMYVVGLTLTFLIAHASYYLFERRFLNLQRHFRRADAEPVAPPTPAPLAMLR